MRFALRGNKKIHSAFYFMQGKAEIAKHYSRIEELDERVLLNLAQA